MRSRCAFQVGSVALSAKRTKHNDSEHNDFEISDSIPVSWYYECKNRRCSPLIY